MDGYSFKVRGPAGPIDAKIEPITQPPAATAVAFKIGRTPIRIGLGNGETRPAHEAHALPDHVVEQALRTGEHAEVLKAHFGEETYEALHEAAKAVNAAHPRPKHPAKIYMLHGTMGSMLGRKQRLINDVVWLNPASILAGRLPHCSLEHEPRLEVTGILLPVYIGLKLRLLAEGFDAEFLTYDWRLSLDEIGAHVAEKIRKDGHDDVILVAHSMGGLASRAALKHGLPQVKKLIMLGTPNHGAPQTALVLRGSFGLVQEVAAADPLHDTAQITQLLAGFPGIYQLSPFGGLDVGTNVFDRSIWPANGTKLRWDFVDKVKELPGWLAPPDERFHLIAGVQTTTVLKVAREGDQFRYSMGLDGDGTVPLASALLPGVKTWYAHAVAHDDLANDLYVTEAVVDIIRHGAPRKLSSTYTPTGKITKTVTDAELRRTLGDKVHDSVVHLLEDAGHLVHVAEQKVEHAASSAAQAVSSAAHHVKADLRGGLTKAAHAIRHGLHL